MEPAENTGEILENIEETIDERVSKAFYYHFINGLSRKKSCKMAGIHHTTFKR